MRGIIPSSIIGCEKLKVYSLSGYIILKKEGFVLNNYDWKDITNKITNFLRINATPVGVKYCKSLDEINSIGKVRFHEKVFSPCTVISQAVQFNWVSACLSKNVHINYCRTIHGMYQKDEKFLSGKIFEKVWFDKLEDAKKHNEALDCLPSDYIGLVAAPLSKDAIKIPDVCIIYANPAQVFLLLTGYQYSGYEKLEFTFVGESTCSDSWVSTILTGKPKVSIPSFADRKFAGVRESELLLSLTSEDLLRAINGVEQLYKNGLRYPIASYSLTTDMIGGLPKSYLEY
jgi:uncharacterized protein (DUF169 family)